MKPKKTKSQRRTDPQKTGMEPRAVQFFHSVKEHTSRKEGYFGWNTGKHKRKFIVTTGEYQDPHGNKVKGGLAFWGEWEAQSVIIPLASPPKEKGMPTCLHKPFLDISILNGSKKNGSCKTQTSACPNDCSKDGFQNTDPFVFGDGFKYIVCRQLTNDGQSQTKLTQLAKGSLILFGSRNPSGTGFVLDTVFVVAEDGIPANKVKHLLDPVYLEATYNRIKPSLLSFLRFYKGVTFAQRKQYDGMFSFFPCQPGKTAFKRPSLDFLAKYLSKPKNAQQYVFIDQEPQQLWRTIVEAITQGENAVCLGIKAKMPLVQATPKNLPRVGPWSP